MPASTARRNAPLLRALTAVLFGVATFGILDVTPFYPLGLALALSAGAMAVAAFSPSAAALAIVVVGSVPLVAADVVLGIGVMIVGLVLTQYLGTGQATGFLLVALLPLALPLGAEWALIALAGYFLGRGRGALTAIVAAASVIAAGLVVGASSLGTVVTGGMAPGLVTPQTIAPAALSFGWLQAAIDAADPGRTLAAFTAASTAIALVLQPLLWAIAALLSASLRAPGARVRSLLGAGGAVAVLAAGTVALRAGLSLPTDGLLQAAAVSMATALLVVLAGELAFPRAAAAAAVTPVPAGTRAEDADVDDLLRIIASAEDELASRHRTEAVVMITDMKSFSAMTEDLGSLESAKVVQRHRDMLLPIIARHGGSGKSTGGDGLVAAFAKGSDAIDAAVEMQRTLEEYCRSDDACAEMLVRVGIAHGEVVCDKGGRPFLGAALNLAARVMDLADGGRIMTTAAVASAIAGPSSHRLHPHGEFKLKNIAEPQGVVEVLWRDGLQPQEIRAV